MSEVVHADIFFFVTTVAVVLVTAGILVVLYFCVSVLQEVRVICAKVRVAADELESDFEELRAQVKAEGVKVRSIVDLVIGFLTYRLRTSRTRKTQEPKDEA